MSFTAGVNGRARAAVRSVEPSLTTVNAAAFAPVSDTAKLLTGEAPRFDSTTFCGVINSDDASTFR